MQLIITIREMNYYYFSPSIPDNFIFLVVPSIAHFAFQESTDARVRHSSPRHFHFPKLNFHACCIKRHRWHFGINTFILIPHYLFPRLGPLTMTIYFSEGSVNAVSRSCLNAIGYRLF